MANLKHTGRLKANQRKCAVAYRVVPGEPESCLVVQTESLMAEEHDALINLIESAAGQEAYELGEAMARTQLPDGRNMLAGFHTTGKFTKLPTNLVEMTPNNVTTILLSELNEQIAEQKGVTINDLAIPDSTGQTKPESKDAPVDATTMYSADTPAPNTGGDVLTDEDLAASYRSQADAMFKEAKRLREQAEELVPTKRKSKASA